MPPLRIVNRPSVTRLSDNFGRASDPYRFTTLKIVDRVVFRLSDNFARSHDPYRFTTLRIVGRVCQRVGRAPVSTALSGFVKTPEGVPLSGRTVRVFGDQAMVRYLGYTYSLVDGSFSISVSGGAGSRYTCVVQGEIGENISAFTNITE
jgi:hypothetical protein